MQLYVFHVIDLYYIHDSTIMHQQISLYLANLCTVTNSVSATNHRAFRYSNYNSFPACFKDCFGTAA